MIKQVRIPLYAKEWHDFRYNTGFGGSDISAVVAGYNTTIAELTYTPPLKYFLQMIGENITQFTGNIASESGHFFEGVIIKWYRHYDLDNPDQMQMFANIKANKRINKVICPKVFVVNSKYPNLFYSPDAHAWKAYVGPKRLVECKNTTSMEARRYENHVSPLFWLQVQMGLMVTELPCADLNILLDGRWLEVITIEPNHDAWDLIQTSAEDFWKKVLAARRIKEEYGISNYFGISPDYFSEKQLEGIELISQLEPDLTGTDVEMSMLKDMIRPSEEDNAMMGTEQQRSWCEQYVKIGENIGGMESNKKILYGELIRSLEGSNKADFNDGSFFSYKTNVKGARVLHVSPKVLSEKVN